MTTKNAPNIDDNPVFQNVKMLSLAEIIGTRDVFALQFCGESMRDEHILDGDYLLVENVSEVVDGDLVVARLSDIGTILRRYYTDGAIIKLQSSDFDVNPILVSTTQIKIQGRVVGLLRDCLSKDKRCAREVNVTIKS
jgi:repressor LexA